MLWLKLLVHHKIFEIGSSVSYDPHLGFVSNSRNHVTTRIFLFLSFFPLLCIPDSYRMAYFVSPTKLNPVALVIWSEPKCMESRKGMLFLAGTVYTYYCSTKISFSPPPNKNTDFLEGYSSARCVLSLSKGLNPLHWQPNPLLFLI